MYIYTKLHTYRHTRKQTDAIHVHKYQFEKKSSIKYHCEYTNKISNREHKQ